MNWLKNKTKKTQQHLNISTVQWNGFSCHSMVVARHEDHSAATTEMWGILFQQGKWFSWGDWAVLFWLWSSSLLCSTGAMNKTFRPVRRRTLAKGSAVQLHLENRGAPHHEKCTESLPFDRKKLQGQDRGRLGADLKPHDAYPQVGCWRVIPFEDYINIGGKHVIIHWGHAPDPSG